MHQKEEKALRARVVETEKQKDAAVESMKNECKGIVGSTCFFLYFDFLFADLFLLLHLALRVEKQKLSEGIEEMKTLIHTNHNKAEEVITRAEEKLMLAKLIRRGANRDLMQAQKTVQDLTDRLATATDN